MLHLFILWHSWIFILCVMNIWSAKIMTDILFYFYCISGIPIWRHTPHLIITSKAKMGIPDSCINDAVCGSGWVTWPTIPCEGQKTWDFCNSTLWYCNKGYTLCKYWGKSVGLYSVSYRAVSCKKHSVTHIKMTKFDR